MNGIVASLKKLEENEAINFLEGSQMGKEMGNGFSGMIMDKQKSKENTTEVKNMESGHFGTIMVSPKNKEHLLLVKQIVSINTGLIMDT